MEGVGNSGRMFLLQTPELEEQVNSLWGVYNYTLKENAELRARLDFQVSMFVCCVLV